jgi:transposase
VHHDTMLLLGLEGLVVDRVELDPDGCRVVHVRTANASPTCPSCATPSVPMKGWVCTRPRDLSFPVPTRLVWRKSRWRCQEVTCRRSSFTESIPQIPSRMRVTGRLRDAAGRRVVVGQTVSQATREVGLS